MNNSRKPTPILGAPVVKMCPVCGKRSYSKHGIHPQCSVALADEPAKERLAKERREKEQEKKGK